MALQWCPQTLTSCLRKTTELIFEIALPIICNTSEFDAPFFIIGKPFRRTFGLAYLSSCGVTHVSVNLMKPWCVGVYVEAQLLAPGMFQSCPQLQALALRISSLPCYVKLTSNLRTLVNRIRAAVKVRHFHSTWYNALNTSIVLAKMLMHDFNKTHDRYGASCWVANCKTLHMLSLGNG